MILESKFTTAVLSGLIGAFCAFVFWGVKSVAFGDGIGAQSFVVKKEIAKNKRTEEKVLQKDVEMESKKISILFGGDMMFDRYIRGVVQRKGFDFVLGDVSGELEKADIVVANLEGPITDNVSKSVGSEFGSRENYFFTFPQDTAQKLLESDISIVTVGNNHISNFGDDGILQTRENLQKAGVKFFGDPLEAEFHSYIKEQNGLKVGFVCFNQFESDGLQKALDDISLVRKNADFVVVYAHWGKEYEEKHNSMQERIGHRLIDVGSDLIIGAHPHVVQDMETYKNKRIYYSLGNFVFDQYFQEETKKGLLVKVFFEEGKEPEFEELGIEMKNTGETVLKK